MEFYYISGENPLANMEQMMERKKEKEHLALLELSASPPQLKSAEYRPRPLHLSPLGSLTRIA